MTPSMSVLDDIIGTLEPEDIDPRFILMARVVDINGRQMVLRGSEIEKFMKNPFNVTEIRVILDLNNIRETMSEAVESIFAEVRTHVYR